MNSLRLFFTSSLIAISLSARAQVVETIAGNATPEGAVSAASIPVAPTGTAVAQDGTTFIADVDQHRIWRLDPLTNTIEAFAGTGAAGFAGDGSAAASASFDSPRDVAVDAAGNVFVADANNHRIRRISAATGAITTYAGNGTAGFAGDGSSATSASLNTPRRIALDASGNLYILDAYNNRIRRVDAATGVISIVVGDGTCCLAADGTPALNAPLYLYVGGDIAFDANDELHLLETMNARVWRIDAATGLMWVEAGGASGFAGDGGPATAAALNQPRGIDFDVAGNLYIADSGNARIRRVDAGGTIDTVAGNGIDAYAGDGSPALGASLHLPEYLSVASNGDLLLSDRDFNRLRIIRSVDQTIDAYAGNGTWRFGGDGGSAVGSYLAGPSDAARDAFGNIYIADTLNNRIRRIRNDGTITTIAGSDAGFGGDGGPASAALLSSPLGIDLDSSGNIYVADWGNDRVRKIDAATGIITTIAGNGSTVFNGDGISASSASLWRPRDVLVDGSGNVYVADQWHYRVRKIAAATGLITTVAGKGSLSGPIGDGQLATNVAMEPGALALDDTGNLYIADQYRYRVRKVAASTGVVSTVAGNGQWGASGDGGPALAAAVVPYGIAVRSGDLFIADSRSIRRVSALTGIIDTLAGDGSNAGFNGDGPAASVLLNGPVGLSLDSTESTLLFADSNNNRVRHIAAVPPPGP